MKKTGPKPKRKDAHLLEGLTNLETGETLDEMPVNYASMKAAAHALKIDIGILKDARQRGCNAFGGNGAVSREKIFLWLKQHGPKGEGSQPIEEPPDEDFTDNYNPPDETGGVGQTLKSLQAYERRAKHILDDLERSTHLHASVKAEKVKSARDAWLKVVNSLLKYDLAVDMAKRESGELMPLADAIKGVHALLAWHTIGTSDALRNVIPELEGKTKFEMAALLDPALRSSIYRNFKLGVKLGKIPEWMGKTAGEFITSEPLLTLEAPKASTNLSDY